MQTTAIFDIAAPFADGSVQVLVISVVAHPIASVAIARPPSRPVLSLGYHGRLHRFGYRQDGIVAVVPLRSTSPQDGPNDQSAWPGRSLRRSTLIEPLVGGSSRRCGSGSVR